MFCPQCGKQIGDYAAFCPMCGAATGGAPARAAGTQVAAQAPVATPASTPQPQPVVAQATGSVSVPKKKRSKKPLVIGVAAVFVVAVIGVGVAFATGALGGLLGESKECYVLTEVSYTFNLPEDTPFLYGASPGSTISYVRDERGGIIDVELGGKWEGSVQLSLDGDGLILENSSGMTYSYGEVIEGLPKSQNSGLTSSTGVVYEYEYEYNYDSNGLLSLLSLRRPHTMLTGILRI